MIQQAISGTRHRQPALGMRQSRPMVTTRRSVDPVHDSNLLGELRVVLGTLAHNRRFTIRDVRDYTQLERPLIARHAKPLIASLVATGYLQRLPDGQYFPTKKGWAWIEGHRHGDVGPRRGDAAGRGARVAPLRVYDMFRVFRAKYKSEGVPTSVVDDLISTYYDAMQAIKHHAPSARGRPEDVAELRAHFRRLIEKLEHHPILAHLAHIQNVIGEGKLQGQKWVSKPASPGFSLGNLYARAVQTMESDFDEAMRAER